RPGGRGAASGQSGDGPRLDRQGRGPACHAVRQADPLSPGARHGVGRAAGGRPRVIDRRQSPITGRVVWRVRWYETEPAGGRHERSRTFFTRREALDFERERARARRAGVVSSSRVSVSEVAERYFANLTGTAASRTIQGYRQHWRTHLQPAFGHVPVERLTVPRIQEFV